MAAGGTGTGESDAGAAVERSEKTIDPNRKQRQERELLVVFTVVPQDGIVEDWKMGWC